MDQIRTQLLSVLEANQTAEEHIEEAAVQLFEDLANDGIKAMIETNGEKVAISFADSSK
jgi:hypothetical protein